LRANSDRKLTAAPYTWRVTGFRQAPPLIVVVQTGSLL